MFTEPEVSRLVRFATQILEQPLVLAIEHREFKTGKNQGTAFSPCIG